jgi:ABC-type amino acid transport substrate-binding protein
MASTNATTNPQADRWERIQSKGSLTIGLAPDLPGMGYWNPEKKYFEGFEADLARQITAELLGSEDKALFNEVMPGERLPRIINGELDMVLSQVTITSMRQEVVDLSNPYLSANEALLVLASSPYQKLNDLKGKTIAVGEDTATFYRYSKLHPDIKLITTVRESDGIYLLLEDKVDGAANDDVNFAGLLEALPTGEIQKFRSIDVASAFEPKPFGICIRKESPIFLEKLNQALACLEAKGVIKELLASSKRLQHKLP